MKTKKKPQAAVDAGGIELKYSADGRRQLARLKKQNRARAFRVAVIEKEYFRSQVCDTKEDFVTDLLADIRHYCDYNAISFGNQDRHAHQNYLSEFGAQPAPVQPAPVPPAPPAAAADGIDELYRAAAKAEHVSEGTLEIDDGAIVSRSEGPGAYGAYIAAWVWIDAEAVGLCPQCGEQADDGEGYDGKCGNCADKAATTST